jgi:hypothetical protein
VTDQETVTGEVRTEQIEVEGNPDLDRNGRYDGDGTGFRPGAVTSITAGGEPSRTVRDSSDLMGRSGSDEPVDADFVGFRVDVSLARET